LSTVMTSPTSPVAGPIGPRLRRMTELVSTTPRRLATLLAASILMAILMALIVFSTYRSINDTVSAVGNDVAPSIVAADHLQSLVASADANALNAVVTKSKPDEYSWSQYRKDIRAAYDELTAASQYTNNGFEQINHIQTMESTLSEYDNSMGQLQVQAATDNSSNLTAAQRLKLQTIFSERSNLVNADNSDFNKQYTAHRDAIGMLMALAWISFLLLLGILGGAQFYLYRRTNRTINLGYAIATVITLGSMIFMLGAFNSGESQLVMAKQQSFEAINSLWTVRATAFNMNANESLYLLNAQDPKSLATAESDFTSKQQKIADALNTRLSHTNYPGERDAIKTAIQRFASYIDIDKNVQQLLAQGNFQQAKTLVQGFNPGQAALAFTQFDSALWNAIDINQFQFDQQINDASGRLGPIPYILGIALIVIVVATIFGMKPRLDEYRF
jgi:hypothetical protein